MIKIILFDDHQIFSKSLELAFKQKSDRYQFGTFNTIEYEEIFQIVRVESPDILLLDIHLKTTNGFVIAKKLLFEMPELKIVFLTGYNLEEYHNQAIKIGAQGFIDKSVSMNDFFEKLDYINQGEIIFPKRNQNYVELTKQERTVLQLIAEGYRQKEIADVLGLSTRTIHSHIKIINEKWNVDSIVSAVIKGIKLGIIEMKRE